MKHTLTFIILLSFYPYIWAQWDPDAGLYLPLTQRDGVNLSASSGDNTLSYANDGDPGTQWRAEPLLPIGFLGRPDLNVFARDSNFSVEASSSPDVSIMTDETLYGSTKVDPRDGKAWLRLLFSENQPLEKFYGRFRVESDTLDIYALFPAGDSSLIGQVVPGQYTWAAYPIPGEEAIGVSLHCDEKIEINQIGGTISALYDYFEVDLGQIQEVKTILSRHWSSFSKSIELSYKTDSTWVWLTSLDPQAKNTQEFVLPEVTSIRYLKFRYEMMPIDYKRAYLWEVTALDPSAPYGAMPEDYVSSQTLRSMLGINAFWGWGYNRYTDGLQPGEGPEMYTPVASYARDYHNMNWDVRDPDDDISFADMAATGGTPAQWWLNWEREYAAWISKGMPVHASIQMVNFTDSTWDNPYSSAYKYGLSFARFFGPTYGNGQVEIVEVGNEPWKYDSTVYRTILRGMTRGLKEGDPAMTVLPCALQAYNPGAEATSNKNYIGARISATEAELIDGLNIHPYSFYKGVDGVRRAVHPEHNYSQMRGILNAIRWRDHNMPGKPIYVTEWGWDSDGATQECVHNECVSEDAAAAYVGRGLLMMQRMGVEKATYFYHSNLWGMTLFTRSGLTGGKEVNFVKKKSYYALQALDSLIGDRHFLRVLQEDDEAWVYLLGDSSGTATHLVTWRPVDGDDTQLKTLTLNTSLNPISAIRLDGRSATGSVEALPTRKGPELNIGIDAYPLVLELVPTPVAVDYRPAPDTATSGIRVGQDDLDHTRTPIDMETGDEESSGEQGHLLQPSKSAAASQSGIWVASTFGENQSLPSKVTESKLGVNYTEIHQQLYTKPMVLMAPIPCREVLTIELAENISPEEVYQLAVWDFNGRKHYSQVTNIARTNFISVNHLPAGAYKFVVFLKNGHQISQTVTVLP